MSNKKIHIIGGGTVAHIRNHLALCAPAYGNTARQLTDMFSDHPDNKLDVYLHLTKMADPEGESQLETNQDISDLVDQLVADESTKIIVMNAALCDFEPELIWPMKHNGNGAPYSNFGRHEKRLKTKDLKDVDLRIIPAQKIINKIRKTRKDITLVAFKTTCGATEDEQYLAGLELMKKNSVNLVLANDTKTRVNMIITPEEARYHVTTDREEALRNLVDMTMLRSHLMFTRSTVVAGEPIDWNSATIPASLREVVNHCINSGAYKPFLGATVGHFACKIDDDEFITSKRKTNFNDLDKVGMIRIKTDGPDTVTAYGAKPSVGGQSQRIIFKDHSELDCIVYFHCPLKDDAVDNIPIRSQRGLECGSHECGANTSDGLGVFELAPGIAIKAVMLDNHGPNIVFHNSVPSNLIIDFIERNWDLTDKTGGYVTLSEK